MYEHHRLPRAPEVPAAGAQAPFVYAVAAPLLANTGLDVARAEREIARATAPFYANPKATAGSPAITALPRDHRGSRPTAASNHCARCAARASCSDCSR
jgi:hypothetical protein